MITNQEFYDKCAHSLRTYGNKYGTYEQRGWGWVNPYDTNSRCAVAMCVNGSNAEEIYKNLAQMLGKTEVQDKPLDSQLLQSIVEAYDMLGKALNDSTICEDVLRKTAEYCNVRYTPPKSILESIIGNQNKVTA